MGVLSGAEGELGLQVFAEEWDSVDSLCDGSIDFSLGSTAGITDNNFVCLSGELFLAAGCSISLLGEEVVLDGSNVGTGDINGSGCSNDVSLVDTSEWDTVDSVGSSDKEESASELFEEDDALSTETSRQDNEDGARGDGFTELGWAGLEAAVEWLVGVLCWVETRQFLRGGLSLGLLRSSLAEVLEATLQLDHLRAAQAVQTASDLALSRHLGKKSGGGGE